MNWEGSENNNKNSKFWEELITFVSYDTYGIENDASNNFSWLRERPYGVVTQ
jgi:hypothetical protein